MPSTLTPEQDLLIRELHDFTNVADPQSRRSKGDCASFMLRVLDQFGDLKTYVAAIHTHNGAYVSSFQEIALSRLMLAMSFEHPGLDRLLAAFLEDRLSESPALCTAKGIWKLRAHNLKSTEEAELPVLINDELNIPHDIFALSLAFPEWPQGIISTLFDEAVQGDLRFFSLHRHIVKRFTAAFNDPHVDEALRSAIFGFATDHIDEMMRRARELNMRLRDPRRCFLLGSVPSIDECVARFQSLVDHMLKSHPDPFSKKDKQSPDFGPLIEIFNELRNACPDINTQHLAECLRSSMANPLTSRNYMDVQNPGSATLVSQIIEQRYSQLHKFLVSQGVSPAMAYALSIRNLEDDPVTTESQALNRVVWALPEPGGPIDYVRTWTQGILLMAGMDQLLDLTLSDGDRFKLYLTFGDIRFRDSMTSDALLEASLAHDLGL
jgi:hypothetical protein